MKKKRLRLLAWVLSLAMLCQVVPVAAFADTGDAGTTEKKTYHLECAEDLEYIRKNLDANYVLDNDIDLSSYSDWTPIGTWENPFTGSFDGQNHTISGLTIRSYTPGEGEFGNRYYTSIGLFGYTEASFSNLNLTAVNIDLDSSCYISTAHNYVNIGSLAGWAEHVDNCTASGEITVRQESTSHSDVNIGGIISHLRSGGTSYSTISNSKNYVSIHIPSTQNSRVHCGGIVGVSSTDRIGADDETFVGANQITNCDNHGTISIEEILAPTNISLTLQEREVYLGGIFGYNGWTSNIDHCRNYASITIEKSFNGCTPFNYGISGIGNGGIAYQTTPPYISNCVNYSILSSPGNTVSVYGIGRSRLDNCYNVAPNLISSASDAYIYRLGPNTSDINMKGCYALNTSCINGSVPTEKTNERDSNGKNLFKEEIAEMIQALFPDEDPRPLIKVSDLERDFEFKRDNLKFLNKSEDFFSYTDIMFDEAYSATKILLGQGDDSILHYKLSEAKLNQLGRGQSPRVKSVLKGATQRNWHGSCFGMSTVSLIRYLNPDRLPLSQAVPGTTATSTYGLKAPKDSSAVTDLINYYHLSMNLPTLSKLFADRNVMSKNQPEEMVAEIIEELKHTRPVIVSIQGAAAGSGAHAVILLEVLAEHDDYYEVKIYDPNSKDSQCLNLYKAPYSNGRYVKVVYGNYDVLLADFTVKDIDFLDGKNYLGSYWHDQDYDYDDAHVITYTDKTSTKFEGGRVYFRAENGELTEIKGSDDVLSYKTPSDDGEFAGLNISFPISEVDGTATLDITPNGSEKAAVDILLKDTLLFVSTSAPITLTYNEAERTVDVATVDENKAAGVNILFTQNTTSDTWPWHSWAIDTTGTTKLHAELDNDGLHLSGDGISGAVVATENAETEKTDTITLPAKAEGETTQEVTISSKKDDTTEDDKLTIGSSDSTDPNPTDPTDPTEPSKPDTPTTPSTPVAPASGSDDGDSGAGALLLVGGAAAAAAITAGVVLSLPVEVQGKAELADHTPLAGAKISLLKDGKVVEQTTADEAGAFSVKVKRGEYQLTAAYTNAEGQIIHQTINVKAPARDLTVTF